MFFFRVAVVVAALLVAAACGNDTVPVPVTPSPMAPPPPAPPSPPPVGIPSTVNIPSNAATLGNRAFVPADLTVAPGTTVTWTNSDTVAHTSTSDAAGWNSGVIAAGAQFSFSFPTAGSFPYHCAIHPGMVGTVTVR